LQPNHFAGSRFPPFRAKQRGNGARQSLEKNLRARIDGNDGVIEVKVMLDEDMRVAVADKIGLVTEAPSHEAMIERVRLVAPELIKDNPGGAPDPAHPARLRFLRTELAF
jgi:hypothetical protein